MKLDLWIVMPSKKAMCPPYDVKTMDTIGFCASASSGMAVFWKRRETHMMYWNNIGAYGTTYLDKMQACKMYSTKHIISQWRQLQLQNIAAQKQS